jgi:hypothetical protein
LTHIVGRPAFFVRQFLVFCINSNNFANFFKHSPSFQYQKIGGEAHVNGIVGFRVFGFFWGSRKGGKLALRV